MAATAPSTKANGLLNAAPLLGGRTFDAVGPPPVALSVTDVLVEVFDAVVVFLAPELGSAEVDGRAEVMMDRETDADADAEAGKDAVPLPPE